MLALVGTALHDTEVPCPELSALSEGTFAAVYCVIRLLIETETDEEGASLQSDEGPSVRELVLLAARKTSLSVELPEISSNDMDMWDDVLDCLMTGCSGKIAISRKRSCFWTRDPKLPASSKSNLESPTIISLGSRPIPIPHSLIRSENL